jgi:hypothetical protein
MRGYDRMSGAIGLLLVLAATPAEAAVFLDVSGTLASGDYVELAVPVSRTLPAGRYLVRLEADGPLELNVLNSIGYCAVLREVGGAVVDETCQSDNRSVLYASGVARLTRVLEFPGYRERVNPIDATLEQLLSEWEQPGFVVLDNFGAGPVRWRVVVESAGEAALVPEPGSWALMIAGFGLVGMGLRRRGRPIRRSEAG